MMGARHGKACHFRYYLEQANLTWLVQTRLSSSARMDCSLLWTKLFPHLAARVSRALVLICMRHRTAVRPGLQPSLSRVTSQAPSPLISQIYDMSGQPM